MQKLSTARNCHNRMQKVSHDFLPFLRDCVRVVQTLVDKIAARVRRGAAFRRLNTSKWVSMPRGRARVSQRKEIVANVYCFRENYKKTTRQRD